MFGENIGASDEIGDDNSNNGYGKHVNNGAKGASEGKAGNTGGGGKGGDDSGDGGGERRRRWLTDIVMGHREMDRIRCLLLDVSKWVT